MPIEAVLLAGPMEQIAVRGKETAPFRRDIEIARGTAILFVYLFHLLPSHVPSGFLGVDIFFVLSGFLMSAVYRPTAPGDTAIYLLRRARRILPAYYTALLAILAVSAVMVLPHDLADVRRHALYSGLLVPNVGFWLDGSYFDKAIFRPALHFWSLGVEIQFYLIVPLIVLLCRGRSWLLVLIALASFLACIAILDSRPRYAFFLTPFRLWEFLLGFMMQRLMEAYPQSRAPRSQWAAVVLLATVCVMVLFPIDEASHPKYQALFVTVTTATLLFAGLPSPLVSTWPGRALMLAGKYSYSIYLVHYPVIRLWFYEPFTAGQPAHVGIGDAILITALTITLSALLFHAVEAPCRKLSSRRTVISAMGGLAVTAALAIALVGPAGRALAPRELLAITDGWADRGAERCGKFAMLQSSISPTCLLTPDVSEAGYRFLLVGDSHADSIKDAMAEVAGEHHASLRFLRENCTVGTAGCSAESIAEIAAQERVGTVIVHSLRSSFRTADIEALAVRGRAKDFSVVVLDPVPVWQESVLRGLYEEWRGDGWPPWLGQTLDHYRVENAGVLEDLARLDYQGVRRFSTAEQLCRPVCAYRSPDGRPFYFDSGHLTITGARQLRPIFETIFETPASAGPQQAASAEHEGARARNQR